MSWEHLRSQCKAYFADYLNPLISRAFTPIKGNNLERRRDNRRNAPSGRVREGCDLSW